MTLIVDGTTGVTFNDSSLQGAAASPFGLKNRIINGDMVIDQRNAGASYSAIDGGYSLDRWKTGSWDGSSSVTGKYTVQQNAGSVTPPAGFTNYLGVTSSTTTSLASGAEYIIQQLIEGYNMADLGWGTANAQTVTLSFWVRSSLTGTFGGSLLNSSVNYSYPFSYTIASANTWEKKTITISGPTSGTWVTTNGIGIRLLFSLGVGSSMSGPAGSWSANRYESATGATNILGTSGATWYITGVQLERNTTATPFEWLPYGMELALCQRYYEKSYAIGTVPGTSNTSNLGTAYMGGTAAGLTTGYVMGPWVHYHVVKRATPTLFLWDSVGNASRCDRFYLGITQSNNQAVDPGNIMDNSFICFSSGSTNASGVLVNWAVSAEL